MRDPGVSAYVRAPDVLWRSASGAIVLLAPADGEVVELTGGGVALWEALEELRDLEAIGAVLAQRFGLPPDLVVADIRPALDELLRRGAVARSDAP